MDNNKIRSFIKETIRKTISETLAVTVPRGANDVVKAQAIKNAKQKSGITDPSIPVDVVQNEIKIKEMARLGKGYRLVNPDIDSNLYATKKISGVTLDKIIEFFRENPGTEKKQLQNHFNFVRPQITNQLVNTFIEAGILEPVEGTGEAAPRTRVDGSVVEPKNNYKRFDPEDYLIGSRMQDQGGLRFDGSDDTEEIDDVDNINDEPEIPELPSDAPQISASINDDDYQTWLKYVNTKERLRSVKLALNQGSRRSKASTDIADLSNDEQRLLAKKTELENRLADLISSSPYIQQKVSSPSPKTKDVDDLEDIEDLDETLVNRFKIIANI